VTLFKWRHRNYVTEKRHKILSFWTQRLAILEVLEALRSQHRLTFDTGDLKLRDLAKL